MSLYNKMLTKPKKYDILMIGRIVKIAMKLINNIRLQTTYHKMKKYNIDKELLDSALSDKTFRKLYKDKIKDFIKYLDKYTYNTFSYDKNPYKKLPLMQVKKHITNIIKSYSTNENLDYIENIKKLSFEKSDNELLFIANNPNFIEIYNILETEVFSENIAEIISNGYGERLLHFLKANPSFPSKKLIPDLFQDKVWNIIKDNPHIGDTTTLELFQNHLSNLAYIINNNYYESIKHSYENVPESKNFIMNNIISDKYITMIPFKQFDKEFVETLGDDIVNELYKKNVFYHPEDYNKLFKVYDAKNYELIKDLVDYNKNYSDIPLNALLEEEVNRELIATSNVLMDKCDFLLFKYFGTPMGDSYYIKIFLKTINNSSCPPEFKDKYGSLIDLLNQITNAENNELIEISKKLNVNKRDEYRKKIEEMEKEGNDFIRKDFSSDLLKKYDQTKENAVHRTINTENGKEIDVYELDGEPFTMLVHAITYNDWADKNKEFPKQIVEDPEKWITIDGGNNFISTSLISERNLMVYDKPDKDDVLMYGFNNIPPDIIQFTDILDAGTKRDASEETNFNMRNWLNRPKVNTVTSIDNLLQETIKRNETTREGNRLWNEIVISRKDKSTNEKIRPDYIVCMDNISKTSKKAAEYFGIPIYLINSFTYKYPVETMIENTKTTKTTNGIHK